MNLLADALNAGPADRQLLAATLAKITPAAAAPEPIAAPSTAPPRAQGVLAEAAGELAREVRRRWQHEEEQRRVQDPFPLPVRWDQAPAYLTDHPDSILRLWPGATSPPVDLGGDLRSVAEVYQRIPSGRLVILGRAGSGKSILTIRFLLDVLNAPALPTRVPVIVGLGSWDPTVTALRDWLVDHLLIDHPYLSGKVLSGSTMAAALLDSDLILPVLDGFDEIAEGLRCAALEAINDSTFPLVMTSRRDEFAEAVQAVGSPLTWAAGIELIDLTFDDLQVYLPRTVRTAVRNETATVWDEVLRVLQTHETSASVSLARALTTPLMVVLARTMYSEARNRDPLELLDTVRFPDQQALEEHLLAGFVPAVYRRRVLARTAVGRQQRHHWDVPHARHWLGYLAHHLARADRGRQDLAWWQICGSLPRSTRIMTVAIASALCIGGTNWLIALLVSDLAIGEIFVQSALIGATAGIAFGSVYAVMAAFGSGVFEPSRVRLRLPGRHSLRRQVIRAFTTRFTVVMLGGFVMGAGCACALALQRVLYQGTSLTDPDLIKDVFINVLAFGLIFASAVGPVLGLMAVLEAPLDVASAATPVALLASNRATVRRQMLILAPTITLTIALGGPLIVGLLQRLIGPIDWPLTDGLAIAAVGGIGGTLAYAFGFTAWGHWVIQSRIWIPLTGKLPWNLINFLDDAYTRGVLRQNGAVYQFRHARLQHHLGYTFRQQQTMYAPAQFTTSTSVMSATHSTLD